MSDKIFFKQLFIVFISSTLAACAGGAGVAADGSGASEARSQDCILQSSIRDYQVLDDSNLVIRAGAKRQYHVELTRRAYGLRSSWNIGFRSPTGRLCGGFGDVIVDDGFDRTEAIRIRSIRALDADQLDDILVKYGKKEPEFKEPLPTEDVDGAEVEELD